MVTFLFLFVNISFGKDYVDGIESTELEIAQWNGLPAAPSVSPTNTARVYYNGTSDTLKLSVNGGAYADFLSGLTGLLLDGSNSDDTTGDFEYFKNDNSIGADANGYSTYWYRVSLAGGETSYTRLYNDADGNTVWYASAGEIFSSANGTYEVTFEGSEINFNKTYAANAEVRFWGTTDSGRRYIRQWINATTDKFYEAPQDATIVGKVIADLPLELANSTTDLTTDVYLLTLRFKDDSDANGFYLRCRDDSSGTPDDVFIIGVDGATTAGDVDITDATPHLRWTDSTASEDDFEAYADGNQWYLTNVTDEKEIINIREDNTIQFYNQAGFVFPDGAPTDNQILKYDAALGRMAWEADAGGVGSGDITSVGDVADGAAFDGTQGTTLTFEGDAGADKVFKYDTTDDDFEIGDDLTIEDATPHIRLTDTDAGQDDFEWYADDGQVYLTNITDEKILIKFDEAYRMFTPQQVHILQGTSDLAAQYDVDPDMWIMDINSEVYPYGIYITKIYVDCTVADPTTELDANLTYCDNVANGAFPGASATLIKAVDTTTGNFADAAVNTLVPSGKTIYLDMDANPTDATTQYHIRIHYTIPTS